MTIGNATTPGVCWTILSDRASRAMAYVGMTRGRDENHLAIYPAVTNEADQHHHVAGTGIHQTQRGTKHAAARALHTTVTANDDRAATMHTVAERTDRDLLPHTWRPFSTATINAAPTAPRPGNNTPPNTAPAKPPTNASPPPAS